MFHYDLHPPGWNTKPSGTPAGPSPSGRPVLLCMSQTGWESLHRRPRQLMIDAAADYQVVFWESRQSAPAHETKPFMRVSNTPEGVLVATPLVPAALGATEADAAECKLLDGVLFLIGRTVAVSWHCGPAAHGAADHISAPVTVVDCIVDPGTQGDRDRMPLPGSGVLRDADLVLMDDRGKSPARRKRDARATRHAGAGPAWKLHLPRDRSPSWQAVLPRPRIGFYGSVDEQLDLALLDTVARLRPSWQFVMIGPIDGYPPPGTSFRPNIHWLGPVCEDEFQACLSGWDAGFLPFAPTADAASHHAPMEDYLAAGVPLVVTPVPGIVARDRHDLVLTRQQPEGIVAALQELMGDRCRNWQAQVDEKRSKIGVDTTWPDMRDLIGMLRPGRVS